MKKKSQNRFLKTIDLKKSYPFTAKRIMRRWFVTQSQISARTCYLQFPKQTNPKNGTNVLGGEKKLFFHIRLKYERNIIDYGRVASRVSATSADKSGFLAVTRKWTLRFEYRRRNLYETLDNRTRHLIIFFRMFRDFSEGRVVWKVLNSNKIFARNERGNFPMHFLSVLIWD